MMQGRLVVALAPNNSGLKPQLLNERCNDEMPLADSDRSPNSIIVSKGWLMLFCLRAIPLVHVYQLFETLFKIMTALKRSFEGLIQTHKRRTISRRIVTTMSTIDIFLVFMGCFLIIWEALFKLWCVRLAFQTIMGNTLDDWILLFLLSLFFLYLLIVK